MDNLNDEEYNYVQYCSNKCIVVINPVGKVKEVYTPFTVSQKTNQGKRRWFIVTEVRSTKEDKLVYMINGKAYYHSLFSLEIIF